MTADVIEHNGRPARLVKTHLVDTDPILEGITWDRPDDTPFFLCGDVVVYVDGAVDEEPVTAGEQDELPEFLRPESVAEVPAEKYPDEVWAEMKAAAIGKAKTGRYMWQKALHFYPELHKHADYHALLILADHANGRLPYRKAWMGQAYIARALGISEDEAGRKLRRLEKLGFLIVLRRGTNSTGRNVSNEYCLSLPEWSREDALGVPAA